MNSIINRLVGVILALTILTGQIAEGNGVTFCDDLPEREGEFSESRASLLCNDELDFESE